MEKDIENKVSPIEEIIEVLRKNNFAPVTITRISRTDTVDRVSVNIEVDLNLKVNWS